MSAAYPERKRNASVFKSYFSTKYFVKFVLIFCQWITPHTVCKDQFMDIRNA